MKLYGGRFLKNKTEKTVKNHVESRDALLYDVTPSERRCRVKIQGTSTLVVAHYPENWEESPPWLKPGNAVRISHTGGVRGRIELIGHGFHVPSPVAGDVGNPPVTSPDAVLTGLRILLTASGDPWNRVLVTVGTYRIDSNQYELPPIEMDGSSLYLMGHGGAMGEIAGIVATQNASASKQYDAINVGIDLGIDMQAGTASATDPQIPTAPADHLQIGWIRNVTGATAIRPGDINGYFTPTVVSSISMTASDTDLAWAELTSTLTVNIKDNYGNPITAASPGFLVKVEFLNGNGTLKYSDGAAGSSAEGYTLTSSIQFTYTRGQTTEDTTPTIKATLIGYSAGTSIMIILRDSDGLMM